MGRNNAPAAGVRSRRLRRTRSPVHLARRPVVAGGALLVASAAGSALAFGAQTPVPLLVAALLAASAAMLLPLPRTPRVVWVLVALAIYTLVQLVPLPIGLVGLVSPNAAAVWRGAFEPFGEATPRFATLSVDPAATALEAAKWSAYACILSAALGLRARVGSEVIAMVVAGAATLVAVVTLVHGAFDIPAVYGVYRAPDPSRWLRGPLLNGNNLSGYLNLGTLAAAGLWLSRRPGRARILFGLAASVMATGSLLAGSRAGSATLILGLATLALLAARTQSSDHRHFVLAVCVMGVVGLAIAAVVGGSRIWETFADTQVRAKVSVWHWTLGMIRDFPVFGVGRGAFETAFEPYRQPLGNDWTLIFAHAENFPLQWVAEWGVPVGLALLAAVGAAGYALARDAGRSPVASGLVTGIAALLVQNFADLALEIFAVLALALVAFAGARRPADLNGRARAFSPAIALTLLCATLSAASSAAPVQVERQQFARAYAGLTRAPASELRAFQQSLRPAVRRHPGESFFPFLGGVTAARLGKNALPWLGRALERSPLDGRVHLALADFLHQRGAVEQAMLHARLAAVYDQTLRTHALRRLALWTHSPADLAGAFPAGLPGAELLVELCGDLQPALVLPCFREAYARGATPATARALADALVQALELGTPPCDGAGASACADQAESALDELEKQSRTKRWQDATLRARLVAWKGEPRRAAATLLERCPATAETSSCVARALELAAKSRDLQALTEAATRYAAVACADPNMCAAAHEHIGQLYQGLDAHAFALRHFTDAAEQSPSAERWLLAAEAATGAGSKTSARVALKHALDEGINDAGQRERVKTLDARLNPSPLE